MICGPSASTASTTTRIQAYDAQRGDVIGEVINASRAGMLILSSRPFDDRERLAVQLHPSQPATGEPVEVTLESVYCEPSQFHDRYGVGFAIVAIRSGDLRALFPQIARARFGIPV